MPEEQEEGVTETKDEEEEEQDKEDEEDEEEEENEEEKDEDEDEDFTSEVMRTVFEEMLQFAGGAIILTSGGK